MTNLFNHIRHVMKVNRSNEKQRFMFNTFSFPTHYMLLRNEKKALPKKKKGTPEGAFKT